MNIIKEGLSRRAFLRAAALIGLISSIIPDILMPKSVLAAAESGKKAVDPKNLTPEEAIHIPKVDIPIIAEDGSLVPIIVSVNHPMEPDHYIIHAACPYVYTCRVRLYDSKDQNP